ncbi:MAG: TIGR04086 family membrane protein [Eubacteriales bacterium]|nr:TIGR04086 family membrane protein [Eubacteriales bacterium]
MDYIRKIVKALIAGYVITLLMLGLLTYFMRKFTLDEKAVDNIIFGIYIAGSFTGAMLSAWMIKKRRVVIGIIYGIVYITVLMVIAAIMKKQAPDSSNNIVMSVAASVAAGAFGGFFSP